MQTIEEFKRYTGIFFSLSIAYNSLSFLERTFSPKLSDEGIVFSFEDINNDGIEDLVVSYRERKRNDLINYSGKGFGNFDRAGEIFGLDSFKFFE